MTSPPPPGEDIASVAKKVIELYAQAALAKAAYTESEQVDSESTISGVLVDYRESTGRYRAYADDVAPALAAAVVAMSEENWKLRQAVKTFGGHQRGCHIVPDSQIMRLLLRDKFAVTPCTCGFSDALAAALAAERGEGET